MVTHIFILIPNSELHGRSKNTLTSAPHSACAHRLHSITYLNVHFDHL